MTPLAALLVERGERVLGSDLPPLPADVRPPRRPRDRGPPRRSPRRTSPADVDAGRRREPRRARQPRARRGPPPRLSRSPRCPRRSTTRSSRGGTRSSSPGPTARRRRRPSTAWVLARGGPGARLPRRRRAAQLRRPSARRLGARLRRRGGRVLHLVGRQGAEVPPLRAPDLRPDVGRVRPRRPLRRPRRREGGLPGRLSRSSLPTGAIVAFGDDPNVRDVLGAARARVVLYGLGRSFDLDFRADGIEEGSEGTRLRSSARGAGAASPVTLSARGAPQRRERPRRARGRRGVRPPGREPRGGAPALPGA